MSEPRSTTMTISRQVLAALVTALAVMVLLILVAVAALIRTSNAKGEVIDRDVRVVIDAYRLDLALSDAGLSLRSFLLTGGDEHLARMEASQLVYQGALDSLRDGVRTDESERLLEEIVDGKDLLDAAVDQMVDEQRGGELALEDVGPAVEDRLTPARLAVAESVAELVEHEERLIDEAGSSADATATSSMWFLVALGLGGVALALAVGWKITQRVNHNLTGMALRVDAAAAEILAGTAQQAAGAAQQASSVQETVTTADELAQTAEQSAERARTVAERAQDAKEVADQGAVAVAESATAMDDIRGQVDSIATTVLTLAEQAQSISGIVKTVEDIADQIHLLALNAAIEAARAGEHGRGFAVVASEVRSLADQSKRATDHIAELLGDIQRGTNTAVLATEQGGRSVADGVTRIEVTGVTIEGLADTVASSAVAAEQIAASSGQQAVATTQILQAMRELDDLTQQSAAAARQAEEAARDMNAVAADLKSLVGAR